MSSEREIVEKFKEAVETKNMGSFAPYLAEDATIQMLPSTVGRKMTGAEWISMVAERADAAESSKFDLVNVTEHPLFIFFQINAAVTFPTGLFTQEMAFVFQYTEDTNGSLKIVNVLEFVDSFKIMGLRAKMAGVPPPS